MQLIILMVLNGERWHYLAVKQLSALVRRITLKHHCDFYCPTCLHSFTTENKRKSRKKVWENKDFCNVVMPSKDTKILEFNQYQKSDKASFIIYCDLECVEKTDGCKNNPENSSTTNVRKPIASGFSMSKISSCKSIEKNHDAHKDKDCMKKFCESLREHAIEIIYFKKK